MTVFGHSLMTGESHDMGGGSHDVWGGEGGPKVSVCFSSLSFLGVMHDPL